MSENPTSPFVFVVGCPRSGTTLLQRMLDTHPELAVANDTHFVPRCLERHEPAHVVAALEGHDVPLTPVLLDGVVGYHRFRRLGLDEAHAREIARESVGYADFVSRLYGAFARSRAKRYGGEKTPDYVKRLDLLSALFPGARAIHILRDGRDVALSVLQWADGGKGPGKLDLWKTEPLAVCALWWSWQVGLGRTHGERMGATRYAEVRYEELVEDAEGALRGLTRFLGLAYSARMVAFHEGRTRDEPGLSAKSAWLPATRGLRDWRREMPERDLALFEELAGQVLSELGYERAVPEPSRGIRLVAERCREWWAGHLRRREANVRRRLARCGASTAGHEVGP